MKKHIIKIALVLSAAILSIACDEDDATGAATVTAKSPSLNVTLDFANSQTLVEQEATYNFTVTLSEPQIVDVRIYLEQISGTATNGVDFSMPSNVTIPAGKTSVSDVIELHADDLIEDTETATIKIGTGLESNVSSIASQTITFSIANLTEGDLAIGLDWETAETITDNYGNEIGAYAAADLRLLLTDVPYTTILDGADGASAEHYVLDGAAPDGEYYIVADFYDATDIPVDLNLTLTFDQVGVINGQTHSFAAALNTLDICPDLYYTLAKITKTGDTYSFEEVGQKSDLDLSSYEGTWSVSKSYTTANGSSENSFTTSLTGETLFIDGIGQSFIETFWGEAVTSSDPVEIQLNADGSVVIPRQYIYTTVYAGDPYDYEIKGSGSWNSCGSTPVLTLTYDIYYPGDTNGIAKDYAAYLNTPYLGGIFTLN